MKDLRIYFNLSLGFVCLFVNHYSCVVLCMLHVPIDCFLRLDFIVQLSRSVEMILTMNGFVLF